MTSQDLLRAELTRLDELEKIDSLEREIDELYDRLEGLDENPIEARKESELQKSQRLLKEDLLRMERSMVHGDNFCKKCGRPCYANDYVDRKALPTCSGDLLCVECI